MEVEIRHIDSQGRVLLPQDWRNRYLKDRKVILVHKGDIIEIRPFAKPDLTKHFDKVEVDLKADLSDWHKVRKELRST